MATTMKTTASHLLEVLTNKALPVLNKKQLDELSKEIQNGKFFTNLDVEGLMVIVEIKSSSFFFKKPYYKKVSLSLMTGEEVSDTDEVYEVEFSKEEWPAFQKSALEAIAARK